MRILKHSHVEVCQPGMRDKGHAHVDAESAQDLAILQAKAAKGLHILWVGRRSDIVGDTDGG